MSSPGWLKSGMAFRMIEDLGLAEDAMIDMAQVPEHRREEVEMRKRVFWSAYSWDKWVLHSLLERTLTGQVLRAHYGPPADVPPASCQYPGVPE